MRLSLIALALVGFLAACSPSTSPPSQTAATPASTGMPTMAHPPSASYNNAFAYCRAVGTIDRPDARYSGPNPPPAVITGLIKAFSAPTTASSSQAFRHGTFWRCMDGKVYACNVGANLPCTTPANTSRAPTAGEKKYCAANHDSLYIPMYVTGHNTIYDWHCEGAQPVAGKQIGKVDKRGYLAGIWYKIPAPNAATR